MSAKNVQIAQFRSRSDDAPADPVHAGGTVRVGRLVSILGDDQVGVAVPDTPGILPARLALALTHERLRQAIDSHQGAVLVFEAQDPARAIVIGLIEPVPAQAPQQVPEPQVIDRAAEVPRIVEADVDGKRVRIVGGDEIVLECGHASITLRRNGRVIIKGTHVETDSAGTNRIKGAAVRIN
jgi:hypothetical protein